jgi:hypothetical protein
MSAIRGTVDEADDRGLSSAYDQDPSRTLTPSTKKESIVQPQRLTSAAAPTYSGIATECVIINYQSVSQ